MLCLMHPRFCSKVYEPFDSSDIQKYVITDDYTPLWEVSIHSLFTIESHCILTA